MNNLKENRTTYETDSLHTLAVVRKHGGKRRPLYRNGRAPLGMAQNRSGGQCVGARHTTSESPTFGCHGAGDLETIADAGRTAGKAGSLVADGTAGAARLPKRAALRTAAAADERGAGRRATAGGTDLHTGTGHSHTARHACPDGRGGEFHGGGFHGEARRD